MSSFIKSKLKNARDAIAKKNYAVAKDLVTEILSYEPDNYNATVFLGLALLELGQLEESVQAYRKAVEVNPEQILGWQGITQYYERTNQWNNYADALISQMYIYSKVDAVKCAELWQKLLECRRKHGNQMQIVDALYKILPGSPFYPMLSELPLPDPTSPTSTTTFEAQNAIHNSLHILEEVVQLIEKEEEETITKEVNRRRMRLGSAGPEQLKKEVGLELWAASKLPDLYNEILNHPNTPDDLRRSTESKLLRYKERYQHALPHDLSGIETKKKVGFEIDELANGAVLLNIPDELAWMIIIDSMDRERICDYDLDILCRYTKTFPHTHLTQLIEGYFNYIGEPIQVSEEEYQNISTGKDPFVAILEAVDYLKTSIFAIRVLSDLYDREADYQSAISTATLGLQLIREYQCNTGKQLPLVDKAFKIVLAKSLVHLFPPKHHTRAAEILQGVLNIDPDNVMCLMCQANILQHAENWREAEKVWQKIIDVSPSNSDNGLEALEEQAWCRVKSGSVKDGMTILRDICDKYETVDGHESNKARVWWRLGKCKWDLGESTREESYSCFISSLKCDSSFAPAFTSLGIYYSDFATPSDPKRASKSFQKAFELDARETEAARRLAEGFAMDREWDLVEVVAFRIIEGEGGLDGGLNDVEKSALARAKPTNAWAWKAMGLVELERHNYPAAIKAFQVCLRTEKEDGSTWRFLGEAYVKAGKYAASLKALYKALDLRTDDWLCLLRIGEVQREIGLLEEASQTFEKILLQRPTECGALLNLAQSLLALGHSERLQGYSTRAEMSLVSAIKAALQIIELDVGFRHLAWKTVIDALFDLSHFPSYVDEDSLRRLLTGLGPLHSFLDDQRLIGLIDHPIFSEDGSINGQTIIKVAAIICSYRIQLFTTEDINISGASYDLGFAFYRFSRDLSGDIQKKALEASIEYLKNALERDPENTIYWNAFGCFNFSYKPKFSQHGFIKALEYDATNPAVWTNLGLFYLENNDTELAMEAIRKALVADPDYTPAWVCEGLIDILEGRNSDARSKFSYGVTLKADVPEADLEFAALTFEQLSVLEHVDESTLELLISIFFSLQRYYRRRRTDPTGLHLFGLVCERLKQYTLAIQVVSESITLLEAAYEDTENPKFERQYAIANTTLGRLLLSTQSYEDALSKFDLAFALFGEDDIADDTITLRASCRLGCGLAYFRLGNMGNSMTMLESALEISPSQVKIHGHITVLLAKVMWSIGADDYKEAAKNLLLDCISQNSENLAAVGALAAMGMLSNDEVLIDAALSEIVALPLEERLKRDPERNIEKLLSSYYLSQGKNAKALSLWQQAVHLRPSEQPHRQKLAMLLIRQGQAEAAVASLSALSNADADIKELSESLRIMALAHSSKDGRNDALRFAQRAIKLFPSNLDTWISLNSMQE